MKMDKEHHPPNALPLHLDLRILHPEARHLELLLKSLGFDLSSGKEEISYDHQE